MLHSALRENKSENISSESVAVPRRFSGLTCILIHYYLKQIHKHLEFILFISLPESSRILGSSSFRIFLQVTEHRLRKLT